MSKATRQVEYEKEIDDVMILVVGLVSDLKAKKSLAEISADNLPKLYAAIGSIGGVAGDFKEDMQVALETIGFRLGELGGALLKSEPASAPVAG